MKKLLITTFITQTSRQLLPSASILRNGKLCNFLHRNFILSSTPSADVRDVLTTQDIAVGTILAFILAFTYSYLNGQSSSTNFVSWQIQKVNEVFDSASATRQIVDDKVFDANQWKEMSREENYVLYNTRVRSSLQQSNAKMQNLTVNKTENKWVLLALLALFVPIFSVELFFALSRQFLCEVGEPSDKIEVVQKLCSPVR